MSNQPANQKPVPSSDPKPVSAPELEAPKPPKDTRPEYIKALPEMPSGASVFVLTPSDENERRATIDQLQSALFKYFETEPTTVHELKAARLPYGSVVYVAHCVTERAKREDGTFGDVKQIHIGGPIELKNYTSRSADGYTWATDLGRVVDAITAAGKHTRGVVWLGALSGDAVYDQKVVKLHRS